MQALGKLSEERFAKLASKYEEEQKHELNADGFLQIVKKYSYIETLTLDILHEFIDKIVVHHREESFGETKQEIEIYYKLIGQVQIPQLTCLGK